ncbi:alpha/beta fold hydrolase [Streptomyces sp. NBC_00435]|uniref:thioesterase II family protein n=1 Tax=Streptomyces sp. NBC_00435 TaxID=2903649 RepID=UPI002E21125C
MNNALPNSGPGLRPARPAPTAGDWLRRFHPRPGTRLVCFPHAGGAASFFFPLSQRLSGADVLAVQYPGRQDRRGEALITDIGELADHVVAVLRTQDAPAPVLFGHSMGAVVAFEVARRLDRAGTPPRALIASGSRAPSIPRTEGVHLRDDEGILAAIRQLNGTDAALLGNEELTRMILPAVRGDYRAVESYRYEPGPPLSCPVVSFIGDADPMVSIAEADAWRDHTGAGFDLHTFPGGHFYLAAQQDAVLEALSGTLAALR